MKDLRVHYSIRIERPADAAFANEVRVRMRTPRRSPVYRSEKVPYIL